MSIDDDCCKYVLCWLFRGGVFVATYEVRGAPRSSSRPCQIFLYQALISIYRKTLAN